jgi:hypothetical protein
MHFPVGRSTPRHHFDRCQTSDSGNFVAVEDVPEGGQHEIVVLGQFGQLLNYLENSRLYGSGLRLAVFLLGNSPLFHGSLLPQIFLSYNLDAAGRHKVTGFSSFASHRRLSGCHGPSSPASIGARECDPIATETTFLSATANFAAAARLARNSRH